MKKIVIPISNRKYGVCLMHICALRSSTYGNKYTLSHKQIPQEYNIASKMLKNKPIPGCIKEQCFERASTRKIRLQILIELRNNHRHLPPFNVAERHN